MWVTDDLSFCPLVARLIPVPTPPTCAGMKCGCGKSSDVRPPVAEESFEKESPVLCVTRKKGEDLVDTWKARIVSKSVDLLEVLM